MCRYYIVPTKRKGAPSLDYIDPMMVLPYYLKVKIRRFPYAETPSCSIWEIILPLYGKADTSGPSPILNPNSCIFETAGRIVRTRQHYRLETLLAGVDAALAELVILTPAVLAQEERPFQTPFLAPAHKSSNSGGFFCGAGLSGLFRSAHSHFASSRCSQMEGVFSGAVLCTSSWTFSSSFLQRPSLMIL